MDRGPGRPPRGPLSAPLQVLHPGRFELRCDPKGTYDRHCAALKRRLAGRAVCPGVEEERNGQGEEEKIEETNMIETHERERAPNAPYLQRDMFHGSCNNQLWFHSFIGGRKTQRWVPGCRGRRSTNDPHKSLDPGPSLVFELRKEVRVVLFGCDPLQ